MNDGSCTYIGSALIGGCMDPNATNYNPNANADDGSCTYKPNAPVITSSSLVCTNLNDGTYEYEVTLKWTDNNNVKGFWFELNPPIGNGEVRFLVFGTNTSRELPFGDIFPSGTQFTVSIFTETKDGLFSSPSSVTVVCP